MERRLTPSRWSESDVRCRRLHAHHRRAMLTGTQRPLKMTTEAMRAFEKEKRGGGGGGGGRCSNPVAFEKEKRGGGGGRCSNQAFSLWSPCVYPINRCGDVGGGGGGGGGGGQGQSVATWLQLYSHTEGTCASKLRSMASLWQALRLVYVSMLAIGPFELRLNACHTATPS